MRIDEAKIKIPTNKMNSRVSPPQRASTYTESYKGEYYNIEVSKLIPFKNQSRKIFDEKSLEELADTIKKHGIRQPLTILPSKDQDGKYEIISGERRWRAAKLVGLNRVPCIIIHNSDAAEEIALIENIQRENLHPLELMEAFQSLLDRKICNSTQEIATKLGISKSTVIETLALNHLPEQTKQTLLNEGVKARKVLRDLGKSPEIEHISIINNYKQSMASKQEKRNSNRSALKLLTVVLNNGNVLFNDDNISELEKTDKLLLKDSLIKFANSIAI